MTIIPTLTIRLVTLLCLLILGTFSVAQPAQLDAKKWAADLNKKHYSANDSLRKLSTILADTDSARAFQFIKELAEEGSSNSYYFQARFKCLKAGIIHIKSLYYEIYQDRKPVDVSLLKKEIMDLMSSAIDIAYRSEDDYLIAFVSFSYASNVNQLGETALTVMYAKNAIDLYEKISYPIMPDAYQFLAEKLYHVREYNECIKYAKKAVITWQRSPKEYKPFTISSMNTVALGYHRQKNYDSAMVYYGKAVDLATQTKDTLWAAIVLGNMGQLFYAQGQYDTAYALLMNDYKASKERKYYDNAANSLQWAAKTNLARGNKTTALMEVREAVQLLGVWPDAGYLRNAYQTMALVFRGMGNYDSAFYYTNLYSTLNDSLERVIATSSLEISKARLNDETSRYRIQTLNREKRAQLMLRNVIIAGVIVLSLLALLVVNRKRLRSKFEKEKIEQEKLLMEQEIASAKEQMKMFTDNIVEKTNLIEKLEMQVKDSSVTSGQHAMIAELSNQTILTEEDWNKFKSLFEKIYPGFFVKLIEKFPDITLAEQRMATLTRLRLTTKQIASMLGISVDSVHKSRQRLRQRFQISADANLDELVAGL